MNRTALVTGASRGIGPHIAAALAGEGMDLVLASRSALELEAVAIEQRKRGVRVLTVVTDLTDSDSLALLVGAAEGFAQGAPSNVEPPQAAQQSPEQLQQLVAPIALYPDALIAQILPAATYPEQVVEAGDDHCQCDRFSRY